MKNSGLWTRIDEFQLDDENSEFTFSKRLARDNKWSHEFSLKVIHEYKKFIYLCCAGYGEITPSDAVDQAWHLHLTYTKSYWIDMCKNTLRMQVHHNPTKGGNVERGRYSNDYDALQMAYKKEFGVVAPKEIWPSNNERFSNIDFKRINLSDYWLVRKPRLTHPLILLITLPFVAALFIQSDNPVPWGSLILVVILILLVVRTIRGGRNKRRRGKGGYDSGCSWWGGFGGCSSDDHSGCSSHGCSGCGGGD